MSFWRTSHGIEVDFVIGDSLAIEVKATANPTERHPSGLRAIAEERQFAHCFLVFDGDGEAVPRLVDGIKVLPLSFFLRRLWGNEFC